MHMSATAIATIAAAPHVLHTTDNIKLRLSMLIPGTRFEHRLGPMTCKTCAAEYIFTSIVEHRLYLYIH